MKRLFRSHRLRLTNVLLAAACATAAFPAAAQTVSQVYGGTLTRQTQTAFVTGDVGLQTYESESIDSNATAMSKNVTVGGYAGESRTLGIFARSSESTTKFDLNDSEVDTTWRDLYLQYRLGFISLSGIASMAEIGASQEEEDLYRIYGTGYGAGATISAALSEELIVKAAAKAVMTPTAHDRLGGDVEVGQRQEAEAEASLDVIHRYVDLLLGYRYRTYRITVADEDSAETQSAPYAGMRFGVYF